MFNKLLSLFRGIPVTIHDTAKIEEGSARTATLGDLAAGATQVLIARVNGKLHAIDTICPHQNGRIEGGKLKPGNVAICAVHGYWFDVTDGSVKRGTCRKAKVYRIEEKDGQATVWL